MTAAVSKGWNALHADYALWEAANLSFCTQDCAQVTQFEASLSKWIMRKALQLRRLQYVDSAAAGPAAVGQVRSHVNTPAIGPL